MPPDIVAAVARRLAERVGLELPTWVVESRTAARVAALDLEPSAYIALIESPRGAGEIDELIEAVRVGETRLFRHRSQIAALANEIAPALRARGKRTIRVWSAGCAAGEEPYTIAIVLARALPGVQLQITATDVSADALELARRGSYSATVLADVPAEWRDAFEREGDRVRVRASVAGLVRFERANLVDGTTPRSCDLVWCRNVLIYFTAAARRRVIDRLVAATNPGGFVFVGYSESLRDIPELDSVRAGDATYYVRRETPRTKTPGVGVHRTPPSRAPKLAPDDRPTPPPLALANTPPLEDRLALRGHPDPKSVTADITARLAIDGLRRLVIDLDGAELLADELATIFRRARAAANAAHVELVVCATRAGARRWLARHRLEELAR